MMNRLGITLVSLFLALNSIFAESNSAKTDNYKLSTAAFTENKGQIANEKGQLCSDCLFRFSSNGVDVYLKRDGIAYVHKKTVPVEDKGNIEVNRTELKILNANPAVEIIKEEKQSYYSNYYLAHCPQGITHVESFEKITYKNIYPQIDWVIYPYTNANNETFIKYDFIVQPGGDIKSIRMQYEGFEKIMLNASGELTVKNPLGVLHEQKPYVYQSADKQEIGSRFDLAHNILSFDIADHDHDLPLVIDPSLLWATYYGGSNSEFTTDMAVDSDSDKVIVTGYLSGGGLPIQNGYQSSFGGGAWDSYVAKFDSSGALIWATYYGGTGGDFGTGITVDNSSDVILLGSTLSTDMPVSNAFQNTLAGNADSYIVKFNSAGVRIWATYYGGSNTENASLYKGVVTDSLKNIIFIGCTQSSDLPVLNAHQNSLAGLRDAFITQLDSNGILRWASYYGGTGNDEAFDVAADPFGNIAFTGYTSSTNFPVTGSALQTTAKGLSDAYVVTFKNNGVRKWATFYGGSADDYSQSIAMDKHGSIAISGFTESTNLQILNAAQGTHNGGLLDAFIVKFDSTGILNWASYYGSTGPDLSYDVDVDAWDNFFITGGTTGNNLSLLNPHQSSNAGSYDVFVTKFDPGGLMKWSTYYGGTGNDQGYNISTGNSGCVYVSGNTTSANFPLKNAYQASLNGSGDAYVIKFSDTTIACLVAGIPSVSAITDSICQGTGLTLRITGGSLNTSAQWNWYSNSCGGTAVGVGDSVVVSPSTTTIYYVRGEGGCIAPGNCRSFSLTVTPSPLVQAGSDIAICPDDSVTLSAGGTATSYSWSNGVTNGVAFYPDTTHTYILTGTKAGCINKDSVVVIVNNSPSVFLGNDGYLCIEDSMSLNAGSGHASYLWNNGATTQTRLVNSLLEGLGAHLYWVRVTDNNSCEATDSILLTVTSCAGINENTLNTIQLYPNPAVGLLNIKADVHIKQVELYNNLGEQVLAKSCNGNAVVIDISSLTGGIYYVKIVSDAAVQGMKKLTVQE